MSVPFLPPFESWHSETLPYPVLVASQLVLLIILLRVTIAFSRNQVRPSRRRARSWLGFGAVYFGVMVLRLTVGLMGLSSHRWFTSHLPTGFHLVLASFLLIVGHYPWRASQASRR